MALLVAFGAALNRIGFSDVARDAITDVDKENLTIDSLALMTDEDVETLCKSIRRPGGTIAGVLPVGAPVGAIPPRIPDPGCFVSAKAERHFKTACFIASHFERTSRTLDSAFLTIARITRYQAILNAEKEYKEPTEQIKLLKPDRVLTFIVNFEQQLHLYNGQGDRPMSYVIRTDGVPLEADDPTFGENGSTYESIRDEIAARSSQTGAHFSVDNARLFELINSACGDLELVKAWIKPYVKARNGQDAWKNFKKHFRGASELEAIEVAAEKRLNTLSYKRESPRYNFEGHVSMHRKAHNDLKEATGVEVTAGVKVRKLLASLSTATALVSAIGTIKATPTLNSDFDEAVNFLKGYLSTMEADTPRNVSRLETGGNNKRKGGGNNNNKNKKQKGNDSSKKTGADRWYKHSEWKNLPREEQERIRNAREARVSSGHEAPRSAAAVSVAGSTGELSSISAITSQRQLSITPSLQKSK